MRVRFRVWNAKERYWAVAWCLPQLVEHNRQLFEQYGFRVKVG